MIADIIEKDKKPHDCKTNAPCGGYGPALEACFEQTEDRKPFTAGQFIVTNNEYSQAVNFCPICGEKAKVPAEQVEGAR